jgi:ElaB/YqjD/DUF883 family membrane-anchored ribosome-binding protein
MVDRNVTDTAQNAAAAAQGAADVTRDYANRGYNAARDYANKGYDAAREYANTGMDVASRVSDNLTEFVRNEPWIAVVAAFAVGYVTARMVRRLSI